MDVDGKGLQKINAPTMAYYTVYGEYPQERLRGRSSEEKKMWNGHDVDASLKDEWLEELNNLPVEIRSTDEGKDEIRVAFVIFRLPEGKDFLASKFVAELNKKPLLKAHNDVGTQGRVRICTAYPITKQDSGWSRWWESLPDKIRSAYDTVLEDNN
ncbi:MAG: hypothetical protein ACQESC_03965 [Nanobdellota archaeon]